MKTIRTWVDPPHGWQYGFPKVKACDTDLREWLIDNGDPKNLAMRYWLCCRFWDAPKGNLDGTVNSSNIGYHK